MPKIVAIVQARMGSTRLPGKPLAEVFERTLLDLMLERVERARLLDEIVLATTTLRRDDELARVARRRGLAVVRGSETDVLSRFVSAAAATSADVVVRLTADCPLLDPAVIDDVVSLSRTLGRHADLVTNAPPSGRTYPDGMDVFSVDTLERVNELATDADDREHVTRRLHGVPFTCEVVDLNRFVGDVRITVDHAGDLERVREIFEDLYPRDPAFGLDDVLLWLDRHSRLC